MPRVGVIGGWTKVSHVVDAAIETRGLAKRYGDVEALAGLDLEVPRGSIFGFLGPNGAGKTTAMRLLIGLTSPTAGHARVLGFDVVTESIQIRRRIGYLAQLPRFYDELTPRQTLRFARGFFPHDPDRAVENDVADALELVGLTGAADQPTGTLSGGQRQRLGIAQACVHRPGLLILDEPAAALDPLGRRDVLDIMRRLRGTTTVFYSTHILDDVQRVSDTVAVLHHGRRVAQASTEVLLAGDGKPTYVIDVRGDTHAAAYRLEAEPWVDAVRIEESGTGDAATPAGRLRVAVRDAAAAERRLLRLLLADHTLDVVSFDRQRFELEDVFVELVEGAPR